MFNLIFKNKMKILKISDSKAIELYKTASSELKEILEESFSKEFFKPKEITDFVYNLETLANYLGTNESDLYIFKNAKTPFEKYINACAIIPKIVNIYNEGIELDWNNLNVSKYLPYFKKVGSGWVFDYFNCWNSSTIGSIGHYYKSSKLTIEGCENFKQIYIDFYSYKG